MNKTLSEGQFVSDMKGSATFRKCPNEISSDSNIWLAVRNQVRQWRCHE